MDATQSDRAMSRLRAAEVRLGELEALRVRLAAGDTLTAYDLGVAAMRLIEARQRARDAESSARQAHERAAAAHVNAATVNDDAGYTLRARAHRQAAERDLEAIREPVD
jgi:hypothetical protein